MKDMFQFIGKTVFNNKSSNFSCIIIWVQLSKFRSIAANNQILKRLQEWIEFFTNPSGVSSIDKWFNKAKIVFERLSNPEQKRALSWNMERKQTRAQEKFEINRLRHFILVKNKASNKIAISREEGWQHGK